MVFSNDNRKSFIFSIIFRFDFNVFVPLPHCLTLGLSRWHAKTGIWQILMSRCIHVRSNITVAAGIDGGEPKVKIRTKNAMLTAGAWQTELWLLYWINMLLNAHRQNIYSYIERERESKSMVLPPFIHELYPAECKRYVFDVELVRTYTHTHTPANWLLCDKMCCVPNRKADTMYEKSYNTRQKYMSRARDRASISFALTRIWIVLKICSKCSRTQKCHVLTLCLAFFFFFNCFSFSVFFSFFLLFLLLLLLIRISGPVNLLRVCFTRQDIGRLGGEGNKSEIALAFRTNRNVHVWCVKH